MSYNYLGRYDMSYKESARDGVCPLCGGTAEGVGPPEYEGEYVIGRLSCVNCGARWVESYRFESLEIIEEGHVDLSILDPAYFTYRQWQIPSHMVSGIKHYIEHGVSPGSFLTTVIKGDLFDACATADDVNIANLPAYAAYIFNHFPRNAWGVYTNEWMEKGGWEGIHSGEVVWKHQ